MNKSSKHKAKLLGGDVSTVEEFEAKYVRPKEGHTLIVGSKVYATREDRRKRYRIALGVDMEPGEGVDRVMNLESYPYGFGPFAHIECLSVLEHCRKPWLLAWNFQRLLEPDGTIHLTVPFVWRMHEYPDDLWRFTTDGIRELFPGIEWKALQFVNATGENRSIPNLWHEGVLYFAKSEVCGFGVRR